MQRRNSAVWRLEDRNNAYIMIYKPQTYGRHNVITPICHIWYYKSPARYTNEIRKYPRPVYRRGTCIYGFATDALYNRIRTMVPGTTTAGHSTPPAVTGFSGDGGDLGDICTNTSDHVIPIHILRLLHHHYLHDITPVRVHILLTVAPAAAAAAVALAVGKFRSYYNNIIL